MPARDNNTPITMKEAGLMNLGQLVQTRERIPNC